MSEPRYCDNESCRTPLPWWVQETTCPTCTRRGSDEAMATTQRLLSPFPDLLAMLDRLSGPPIVGGD